MAYTNYAKSLMSTSSSLDAVLLMNGKLTLLAKDIVDTGSESSIKELLSILGDIKKNKTMNQQIQLIAASVKESLIGYQGYKSIKAMYKTKNIKQEEQSEGQEEEKLLPEILSELDQLIGLEGVKHQVCSLVSVYKVQKLRLEYGLKSDKNTMHLAFTGNPGTGKTTVARIIGRIYKQLDMLSKGHFIEASRTDLIASYQGQTATKVSKLIERAKGGVLFIDEAYSITENEQSDSYGRECITELTKALEDYRDDLVVIVAGYTKPMEQFFESNPGLKSRFNTFIEFGDYTESELFTIFEKICMANYYILEESLEEKVRGIFNREIEEKDKNFANGRLARNIYDSMVTNHANRVAKLEVVNKEILMTLVEEDLFDL